MDSVSQPAGAPPSRLPSCDPAGLLGDVTDVLRKIREERGRPLFALVAHFIGEEVADEVYSWRSELREAGKDLDILICSPGGELTSCYVVARLFSRCTDAWEGLIPAEAASGATLICLGSSNLVMAEIARLGPIDPQVISKRREKFFESERQSPLEAFEAVRYLREFTIESLDAMMSFLLNQGVDPHLALQTASRCALGLSRPMLEKIEPFDLGELRLDSGVAIEYCHRVGNPTNAAQKAQRGVDPYTLVEDYPAHEFAIDPEEARALNFLVSDPSPQLDDLFDKLRPILRQTHKYVGLIA